MEQKNTIQTHHQNQHKLVVVLGFIDNDDFILHQNRIVQKVGVEHEDGLDIDWVQLQVGFEVVEWQQQGLKVVQQTRLARHPNS